MGSLINLRGVFAGRIDNVPFFKSAAHAIRLLREHRACTDAGKWNCLFSRHHVDIEHSAFDHKSQVRIWLNTWHPRVKGPDAASNGGANE